MDVVPYDTTLDKRVTQPESETPCCTTSSKLLHTFFCYSPSLKIIGSKLQVQLLPCTIHPLPYMIKSIARATYNSEVYPKVPMGTCKIQILTATLS